MQTQILGDMFRSAKNRPLTEIPFNSSLTANTSPNFSFNLRDYKRACYFGMMMEDDLYFVM